MKLAKYLPEIGWQPFILTKEIQHYQGIDETLNDDLSEDIYIYRVKEWNLLSTNKKSANIGVKAKYELQNNNSQSILTKYLDYFFFYDYSWLIPAFIRGLKIIKGEGIDLIFSTSPNPEAHLVGLGLKIVTGKPWVADFRDPWTVLHATYRTGRIKMGVDRLCEKVVVTTADHITAISQTFAQNLNILRGHRKKNNVSEIYNGYDENDFNKTDKKKMNVQQPFTITYLGTWGSWRTPEPFLRALGMLFGTHPELKDRIRVNFVGEVKWDPQMEVRIEQVIVEENLDSAVKMIPFLSYRKALELLRHGDVSLLVVSPYHSQVGCLSSKLFEYLYAGKPILALAPLESEEAQIIRATNAGKVAIPDDAAAISRKIEEMYIAYQKGDLVVDINTCAIERFDRKRQIGELAAIFDKQIADRNTKSR